jgi:hypothetical protein
MGGQAAALSAQRRDVVGGDRNRQGPMGMATMIAGTQWCCRGQGGLVSIDRKAIDSVSGGGRELPSSDVRLSASIIGPAPSVLERTAKVCASGHTRVAAISQSTMWSPVFSSFAYGTILLITA